MAQRCCSSTRKLTIFSIIGFLLSVIGAIVLAYFPHIFTTILNSELAVTPTSKSYSLWKVTPIPLYIEFYCFNWTNPQDIRNPKIKPNLQEMGPYVFREHRVKVISDWAADNETVTFRQNRTWIFEPSLSNGSLSDKITTLNIPAITAAYAIRDYSKWVKFFLNLGMAGLRTKYHVTKTAGEFLFDGYEDPLLDVAAHLPPGVTPVHIPFDKFGWFYTRNGSADYDGIFNMQTGVKDITKLGVVSEWDYANQTKFYHSYCGAVNDSAGELFPPNRDKTKIGLFSPDICRTLPLTFKEEVTVEKISGYRYWGDDQMFANQTSAPDNWCFCGDDGKMCYPNGILNVTSCKWGAPAFISFPHFYHADPVYRSAVTGMDPEEDRHQMFIDLEPRTGIPLQVAASFQINILLQPMEEFSILKNMPRIFFPVIWFKQTARIDDIIGPQVRSILLVPQLGLVGALVTLSVGVSILVIVGVICISLRCKEDDEAMYLVSAVDS